MYHRNEPLPPQLKHVLVPWRIINEDHIGSSRVRGANRFIHLPFDKVEVYAPAGRQLLPHLIEPLTVVLIGIDPSDRWKCRLVHEGSCAEISGPKLDYRLRPERRSNSNQYGNMGCVRLLDLLAKHMLRS